jgi:hypothetical protein
MQCNDAANTSCHVSTKFCLSKKTLHFNSLFKTAKRKAPTHQYCAATSALTKRAAKHKYSTRHTIDEITVEAHNMQQILIAKQTLHLCHAALTQTLDAALAVQDQSRKTFETLLDETAGFPVEGRRAITDWIDACRQQTTAIKNVIDDGFRPFHLHAEE